MDMISRITGHFEESARLKLDGADLLAPGIAMAAAAMAEAFLNEKKVLACGNGGSAAFAQYFAANMLNRFDLERPGLPAVALSADNPTLTCIANDSDFVHIFSKQVQALGQGGDILLAMSTSGNSRNVLHAVTAAHERGMLVVAVSGSDGGNLMELLRSNDIHIGIPHENPARVQEMVVLTLHCLCDSIDSILLGVE